MTLQLTKNSPKAIDTTRRKFLKTAGLGATTFMIVPRHVLGGPAYTPPSDKLNIAGIGVGGRGADILRNAHKGKENIVALCDVDDKRAADTYKTYSKAKRYKDFRKMLEQQKDIDAVMVGAPDHIHAVAALPAMQLGKHVYVEKPLAHNIYETRLLTEAAQKYKVATQMGNQGASEEGVLRMQEWYESGLIGEVHRVHCWTNRPIWPQGIPKPTEKQPIPTQLDWNLWQGPAKTRPYNAAYLPFKWRGWWDYGTGALGDMGCHILDPVYRLLQPGFPTQLEASVGQVYVGDFQLADYADSCPPCSKIHIKFPEKDGQPALEVIWYDGGILPQRPDELKSDEMMGDSGGGCIFEGSKGKMMCGVYGRNPTLLPTQLMQYFKEPEPFIPRVPEGHQRQWVNACKNGTPTNSSFDYAGPFTEMVLIGNLAIRAHEYKVLKPGKKPGDWDPYAFPGRTSLFWDSKNIKITNFDEANRFVKRAYRKGWEI